MALSTMTCPADSDLRASDSKVDYCRSILVGISGHLLSNLQSVLNAAARLIFLARRSDHTTPLLRERHWPPIPERIQFQLCFDLQLSSWNSSVVPRRQVSVNVLILRVAAVFIRQSLTCWLSRRQTDQLLATVHFQWQRCGSGMVYPHR